MNIKLGIIGWGGAYDIMSLVNNELVKTLIGVAMKKDFGCPTEILFEKFNVLSTENVYFKISTEYIKKNVLYPSFDYVNIPITYRSR